MKTVAKRILCGLKVYKSRVEIRKLHCWILVYLYRLVKRFNDLVKINKILVMNLKVY